MTEPSDLARHDRFVLRQRFRPVVNIYDFSIPTADGGPGERVCFVQQRRFKFKEDIRFYADDTKAVELMRIKARHRFDPRARYDVTDAAGGKIGGIQKLFGESLLRSTYVLYDERGQEVARAREASIVIALFRRLVGFIDLIPFVPPVTDWLPIPYDFVFTRDGETLGTHRRRRFRLRDTYDIDLTPDTERTLDRRLILAIAVGMDALQAR